MEAEEMEDALRRVVVVPLMSGLGVVSVRGSKG